MGLLLVVNYFIFFRADAPPDEGSQPIAAVGVAPGEPGGSPRAARALGQAPGDDGAVEVDDFGDPVGRKVTGELKRGQTILNALRGVGIDGHTAQPIIQAMGSVFDFRKAQVGDTFTAHIDDDGQVSYFSYTQSPLDVYEVVRNSNGEHEARKKKVPTRIDVAHIGCAVKSSLYESIARCGEGPELASRLIDLLAWDVDFFQDVRDGDEFKVIVEKISIDGRFLRYGNVLAAQYKGKLGDHRIVSYVDPDGREGYYKPDGHAVRKEFIKSPLKYSKVAAEAPSSTAATNRASTRARTASAMVYTAKANTPVWAVAGGTVVFAGDAGNGLGRSVTIKHDNGYTSTYAYLGSIATGLKVGTLVKQKTVVGKVGKGTKTESPELLFSLRKDGRLVNPLKMTYAEGDPVAPEHKSHFEHEVQQLLEDLDKTPIVGAQERRG